jgi:large subunit ribosomal protein L10
MSKPVKNMLIRDYQERLGDTSDALVVSIRGIGANDNNKLRQELASKDIRITVVRNNLHKHAFGDTPLGNLEPVMKGPSALAYGAESVVDVARELVKWAKEIEHLELKGAILDGELFEGEEGVERLSKFPTREEAIAQTVTLILSPAQKLVGAVKGPGSALASILKSIEEKLEKGETIAKTG